MRPEFIRTALDLESTCVRPISAAEEKAMSAKAVEITRARVNARVCDAEEAVLARGRGRDYISLGRTIKPDSLPTDMSRSRHLDSW